MATCPEALWKKLPFLPSPPTPGFNPGSWSEQQYVEYAKGPVLTAAAAPLAFVAAAVALIFVVLLWRLLQLLCHWCELCCPKNPALRLRPRKSLLAFAVMHDKWMVGYKVALTGFALACIALAVTGLATLPKGHVMLLDLGQRLDSASVLVSGILAASDDLYTEAYAVRPALAATAAFLQQNLTARAFAADAQCVGSLLDTVFRTSATPQTIANGILSASLALRSPLSTAMASAASAMDDIAGSALPAFGAVAAAPGLLSNVSTALVAYDNALAALPPTRNYSASAAVSSLQGAQNTLALTDWVAGLASLQASLRTMVNASQQQAVTDMATSVQDLLQTADTISTQQLAPLAAALQLLDSAYTGRAVSSTTGRLCLARASRYATVLDEAIFTFKRSLERRALETLLIANTSLGVLFGIDAAAPVAVPAAADPAVQAVQQLAQLAAGVDSARIAQRSAQVQAYLTYPNGTSALPATSPLLAYLAQLVDALVALGDPAARVAAALNAYAASPSNATYAALYNLTSAAPAAPARAKATAPLPAGSDATISAATSAAAAGQPLAATLATARATVSNTSIWLAVRGPLGLAPDRSPFGLGQLSASLARASSNLVAVGWNASLALSAVAAPPPSSASASSNGTLLSAILQPLMQSVLLIDATLANGLSATAEQLDNALGKQLARRSAQEEASGDPSVDLLPALASVTSTVSTSSTSANTTTQVREQLIRRLDQATVLLRGANAKRYSQFAYWGAVAAYSCIIATALFLTLATYLNWHNGLVALLVLHLCAVVVMLAGAMAAAVAMVAASDGCKSVDQMAINAVSPRSPLFALVRYVLQGVGGSLAAVLRSSGLGDTSRLAAAASAVDAQLLSPMLLPPPSSSPSASVTSNSSDASAASVVWPSTLGSVEYALGGVLVDLAGRSGAVQATLGRLLSMADRHVVLSHYQAVCSWACCDLGGQLMLAWICATGCGILGLVAGLAGVCILKNLDDLPDRKCCACYRAANFPPPAPRRRGRRSGGGGGASSGGGGANSGGGAEGGAADGRRSSTGGGAAAPAATAPRGKAMPPRSALLPTNIDPEKAGGGIGTSGAAAAAAAAAASAGSRARQHEKDPGAEAQAAAAVRGGQVEGGGGEAVSHDAVAVIVDSVPRAPQQTLQHRPSVSVCIMDEDIYTAFGFDGNAPAPADGAGRV